MASRKIWGILVASTALTALAVVIWLRWPGGEKEFPLPPYSKSANLNTGPDAQYIGSAACAGCHAKEHRSYLLTAHSRALSDVDPAAQPADGGYEHALSGRAYRVYRKAGQLRHEETMRNVDGNEMAHLDLPIRYLVGSGAYSRTYLFEADGFLHESPITWYASRKGWDMSPGYDSPKHFSFDRPVTIGCLVCHAGRVEAVAGAVHRVKFHEKAIGCESCHGPGSLHQSYQRTGKHVSGEDDLTIVKPTKLSRGLEEAICAACHLHGPATVGLRGRAVGEFRPGLPLTDFRADYRFDAGNEQMTVVGHMEQMRQSVCYQKSDRMTCVSCHDMHARTQPKDKVSYYRQKCTACHAERPCTQPVGERLKRSPQDDCTACHMPRGDTDVPHVAFTHHRVGLHKAGGPAPAAGTIPDLVAIAEGPAWSEIDRKRNLGLAHLEVYREPAYAQYGDVFRERAKELLEAVYDVGLREAETCQALAEIYSRDDLARASDYAKQALTCRDILPDARAGALTVLAYAEMQEKRFETAAEFFEQLTQLRRYADDWRLLGVCYLELSQPKKALMALDKSLAIRPSRHATHAAAAEACRRLGDQARAADHDQKAKWLLANGRD